MPCLPTLMHSNVLLGSLMEGVKLLPWQTNSMVVFVTGLWSEPWPAPSSSTSTLGCHTSLCPTACSQPFPSEPLEIKMLYLIILVTLNWKMKKINNFVSLLQRHHKRLRKNTQIKGLAVCAAAPSRGFYLLTSVDMSCYETIPLRFFYFSG